MTKEEYEKRYKELRNKILSLKITPGNKQEYEKPSEYKRLLNNARDAGYNTNDKVISSVLSAIFALGDYVGPEGGNKRHHLYKIFEIFDRVHDQKTARTATGLYELLQWYDIASGRTLLSHDLEQYRKVFKFVKEAEELKKYENGEIDENEEDDNDNIINTSSKKHKEKNINELDDEIDIISIDNEKNIINNKEKNINAIDESGIIENKEKNINAIDDEPDINDLDDKSKYLNSIIIGLGGSEASDDTSKNTEGVKKKLTAEELEKKKFVYATKRLKNVRGEIYDMLVDTREKILSEGIKRTKSYAKLKNDLNTMGNGVSDDVKIMRINAFFQEDGTSLYRNMARAINKCILYVSDGNNYSQEEIEKELDVLQKAVNAYVKGRDNSSGKKVNEYGTVRLNLAKRLKKGLEGRINENMLDGRYLGYKLKTEKKTTIAQCEEYAKSYIDDLNMDEYEIDFDILNDSNEELKISKYKARYIHEVISKIPGAKEFYKVYAPERKLNEYLSILMKKGDASIEKKATWFALISCMRVIDNRNYTSKGMENKQKHFKISMVKSHIADYETSPTFKDIMNTYGIEAFDQWQKVINGSNDFIDLGKRKYYRAHDEVEDRSYELKYTKDKQKTKANEQFLMKKMEDAITMWYLGSTEITYELSAYVRKGEKADELNDIIENDQRVKDFRAIVARRMKKLEKKGWLFPGDDDDPIKLISHSDYETLVKYRRFHDVGEAAVKEYEALYKKGRKNLNNKALIHDKEPIVHDQILNEDQLHNKNTNKNLNMSMFSEHFEKNKLMDD